MRFITKENVYVMSLFACFLVINVILAFPIRSIGLFTLNVLGAIAILNAFLCRYVLIVNNDTISYHTKLLGWSLYKRSFSAEQIAALHFRRFHVSQKCVHIIPYEGRKLSLRLFKGNGWLQELEQFAVRNGIDADKSDDYLFIEQ